MRTMMGYGLLALVMTAGPLVAAEPQVEEVWFRMLVNGEPSGWSVIREKRADDRITTETETHIVMRRLGQPIEMNISTGFTESKDHKPLDAMFDMGAGAIAMTSNYAFKPDGIHITSSQMGRQNTRVVPNPAQAWMTPLQIERYTTEQLTKGAKEFQTVSFDTTMFAQLVTTSYKVLGEEVITVGGRQVPAYKLESVISVMPTAKSIVYADRAGRPLRLDIDMMGMKMVQERADKTLAQSKVSGAELMSGTLITVDKPFAEPRKLERAVYTLSVAEGELPTLPDTSSQTFARINKQKGTLVVDLNKAATRNGAKPAVARSIIVDGADPNIVKLKNQVVRGLGNDPAERAEAMRAFVNEYIDEKSLDVGFATASEVCKTRQGDCSEHAVLLAAMLRADGIPSRTASGLMYVPAFDDQQQVFGYHMWTQAWIDGRWVDYDAVLPAGVRYDATHITVGTSLMNDGGWVNDFVKLAPLMGQLSIEVVKP